MGFFNRNICSVILMFFGILMLGQQGVLSAEPTTAPLVMATPEGEGVFTRRLKAVYEALGRESGVNFVIRELPKERALVEANDGRVDGLAARVPGMQSDKLPDIRMVNVSHLSVQHVLFVKQPALIAEFRSFEDMKQRAPTKKYLFGYLRGSKKSAGLLADLPGALKIGLSNPEQAFSMLMEGRIAAYLAGPAVVNRALLKEKFADGGIQEVALVSETALFPYVHKSHQDLIPQIERALRTLRDNGTLARLQNEF